MVMSEVLNRPQSYSIKTFSLTVMKHSGTMRHPPCSVRACPGCSRDASLGSI